MGRVGNREWERTQRNVAVVKASTAAHGKRGRAHGKQGHAHGKQGYAHGKQGRAGTRAWCFSL